MDQKPSTSPDDGRIEVSIVGSPEVFGGEKGSSGAETSSAPSTTDEKSIEKKDQSPRAKSEEIVVLDSDTVPLMNNGNNGNSDKASPGGDGILGLLQLWQWVVIDGIQLPAIQRGPELYLAVHNVQLKLLSRFPPGLSKEVLTKFTMVSHRMTHMEALVLNSINAVIRRCDLGCQLFHADDEVVLLRDVELFYWNIKAMNLSLMVQKYDEEIGKHHDNIALMSVITAIRHYVENEVDNCKVHIQRLDMEDIMPQATALQHATPPNVSPAAAVASSTPNSIHGESKVDINVFS